jgi:energy-coupling factor transporter ATP-binding protein EcfA2
MAIAAENLCFAYAPRHGGGLLRSARNDGGAAILDDFSAVFERGQLTAVCGANGCGKTTLARLLVGILKPLRGRVLLDGAAVSGMTLTEVGRRVGFVMQDASRQLFCTSVKDEAEFGLKNMGLPADEAQARAAEYLDFFGLGKHAGRFPFELSGGEKQRLVLASVMAMRPGYLILDEPTSSLDKGMRRALGGLLLDAVKKDGVGIVLISHDRRFVGEYADAEIRFGTKGGTKGDGSCVCPSVASQDTRTVPFCPPSQDTRTVPFCPLGAGQGDGLP